MNNFEKEAQNRSVTKMLGRALNPMEWVRQMSSSKYRRMIAAVDAIDKVMRNNILRLKPGLRDYLHQARMAMKNREFLKVFQYSNYIIDSVNGVFIDQMDELEAIGREIYSEFSNDKMDEFERKQLEEELGVRNPRVASVEPELVIEAGVTQWLQEKIPTRKEIEGTLFDKIFRNMQGKQQEAARQALAIAERTYELIQTAFDTLDNERRNIVEYVRLARDYQRKLGIEKDRLKKMYINYFPAQPAEPQQTTNTTEPPPQTPPPPPVQTTPVIGPAVSPTTAPVTTVDAPQTQPKPGEPATKKSVLDLLGRAKIAVNNGDNGIASALLAKASEICDDCGYEEYSIKLLSAAIDLQLPPPRGRTVDVCIFDEISDWPKERIRFSKERVINAFMRGYTTGTPKLMVDGKEIK